MQRLATYLAAGILVGSIFVCLYALCTMPTPEGGERFAVQYGIASLVGIGAGLAGAGFLSDMFSGGRRGQTQYGNIDYSQLGVPGYDARSQQLQGMIGGVQGRPAPQAGPMNTFGGATIDPTQQAQFRAGQLGLMQQLQQQAAGQGPSLAGQQLRQAADRFGAQQQGLAAGAPPGQSALAARQASMAAGQQQSALAGQAAQARMQEQLSARQQLAGVMGQGRAADIGLAQAQAQLGQQAGMFNAQQQNQAVLANLQAQLQARGMNDQQISRLLGYDLQQAMAAQQGGIAGQQMATQRYGMDMSTPTMGENLMGMGMGLLGLPGGLGARGPGGAGRQPGQ